MKMKIGSSVAFALSMMLMAGCSGDKEPAKKETSSEHKQDGKTKEEKQPSGGSKGGVMQDPESATPHKKNDPSEPPQNNKKPKGSPVVVSNPESIPVLVNKQSKLPENYTPKDLIYPNVPFIFAEKIEKRKMRKPAAQALEKLFAAAEKNGVPLSGVSAYRSHAIQTAVFNNYVKKDGYQKARTYSALPGTSEHETGLSIDVTSRDGKCPAQDCFDETKQAKWLAKHASEYGFIIRYPKGKDNVTGYKYEPWHIRFVGKDIAVKIAESNGTLEEYLNAVPVAK
ncbi:peptidase M15B and M15C DD-carboxypeptidase VanY/endolysin [Fictibacillus macauensis ZFHKF-1]|uniref:Peptidase M15B and M15C DD-carboxypeptidase VanY/endolysin n=1 Tax=Fictibacillus macauensis ZFHKF-1 TaxID=1196324 RepID=I8AJI1_9BACL|nr:M15 family metallopeptidase [Fictibacillus macauensis]EIT85674.1 peptidase M15B and M15C DD-carboxypeptidase VanY/endolysin [Fictibacillus macauensis ZFHKF-1]